MNPNDIVRAINNKPLEGNEVAPPLILDTEYKVKQLLICNCGQVHVDVGLTSRYNYITCYKCKKDLLAGDKIHWCHPSRFINQTQPNELKEGSA